MSQSTGNGDICCRIVSVGDIFPADHYFTIGSGLGSRFQSGSAMGTMSVLKQLVSNKDIVIGNLEAPLCDSSRFQVSYARKSFHGSPRFAKELRDSGFSLINIANNHIMQHGSMAFNETIAAISNEGMSILGLAGDDGYYSKPVFMRKEKNLIGILGYSIVDDPFREPPRPYAQASPEQIIRDVSQMSDQCDVLVVSIHGGQEGSPLPDRLQRDLFRKVIESGANLVIGHHSHVVQPVEKIGEGVIFYSLGNFIFDVPWFPEATNGAIAIIEVCESGALKNEEIIGTKLDESLAVTLLDSQKLQEFDEALVNHGKSLLLDEDVYDLVREKINSQILRNLHGAKLQFFFRNLGKGDTGAKIRFLIDKLIKRL